MKEAATHVQFPGTKTRKGAKLWGLFQEVRATHVTAPTMIRFLNLDVICKGTGRTRTETHQSNSYSPGKPKTNNKGQQFWTRAAASEASADVAQDNAAPKEMSEGMEEMSRNREVGKKGRGTECEEGRKDRGEGVMKERGEENMKEEEEEVEEKKNDGRGGG